MKHTLAKLSKLTMSLVNETLKFQIIIRKNIVGFWPKNVRSYSSAKAPHNVSARNITRLDFVSTVGGGRVVRRCWVNFQCQGVLLIWIRVGQGPTALAVGAGGGCLDIFSLIYHFSFLSPFLWETAHYRLKYCLKGPLSPKTTNQPIVSTVRLAKSLTDNFVKLMMF